MAFGAEQMVCSAAVGDYQEERQYTDAAEPLRQRPPEQNALRHSVEVRKDGYAGGRKTAHRLEI